MPKTPHDVVSYYHRKADEYDIKYSINSVTHIHTGYYDGYEHPELFRPGWIAPSLGAARLRLLMHLGQDRTVRMLIMDIARRAQPRLVLDCGAGHGGTSLLMAQYFDSTQIDALTISSAQGQFIEKNARDVGLDTRIRPVIGNVLEPEWPAGQNYDLIVGIESFCQIGNPGDLMRILRSRQPPGALLAVSDYFIRSSTHPLREQFNDYWWSDITCLRDTIAAIEQANYRLLDLRDRTAGQQPFWQLSMAYAETTPDHLSSQRIDESRSFHRLLADGFHDGQLSYCQLVCQAM